jgi:hypothetical protein
MTEMLRFNPNKRMTVDEALEHEYFKVDILTLHLCKRTHRLHDAIPHK